tara:strand:+ start:942 stop:1373 length:432 start_codon:yes stop_codon:yes gene_type:complete
MNYYFFLNSNNIIDQVVCNDDTEDLTNQYSQLRNQRCIKRSNAENLPGIGYTYMDDIEAFVKPQPFPSWTLNTETAEWQAPKVKPDDGNSYMWDESDLSWQMQPTSNLSTADADLIASVSSLEEFEAIKDQLSEEGLAQLGLN